MERYLLDRAVSEPRRASGAGNYTSSNYYFCPLKCPSCIYFYESNSTSPYECKQGTSDNPSKKSIKEGFKQYDHCKYWKEKTAENTTESYNPFKKLFSATIEKNNENIPINEEAISPTEKRRLEREERERVREREHEDAEREREREEAERDRVDAENEREEARKEEERRTHCFYCGNTGYLLEYYHQFFHENCLIIFKESKNGIQWIAKQEKQKEYIKKRGIIEQEVEKYCKIFKSYPYEEIQVFTGIDDVVEATLSININEFYPYLENEYKRRLEEKERADAELVRLEIERADKRKQEETIKYIEKNEIENETRIKKDIKDIVQLYLQDRKRKKSLITGIILLPVISYIISTLACNLIPFSDMGGFIFGGEYSIYKMTIIVCLILYIFHFPKYIAQKKNKDTIVFRFRSEIHINEVVVKLKRLYEEINQYSDNFKEYIYLLNENSLLLEKAKHSYAFMDNDELPIIHYNDTATSSAKDGFVLTNKNVYLHSAFEKKEKIALKDINLLKQKSPSSSRFNIYINHYEISLSVLSNLDKQFLFYFLKEVLSY